MLNLKYKQRNFCKASFKCGMPRNRAKYYGKNLSSMRVKMVFSQLHEVAECDIDYKLQ